MGTQYRKWVLFIGSIVLVSLAAIIWRGQANATDIRMAVMATAYVVSLAIWKKLFPVHSPGDYAKWLAVGFAALVIADVITLTVLRYFGIFAFRPN